MAYPGPRTSLSSPGTGVGSLGDPSSARCTRKNRMGASGSVHPDSTKVRLSGAAARSCHEERTPVGSGMAARNAPVVASYTAGRTGVKTAVFESFGKRASGALAVTKKRGGPAAARGEEVAMGDDSEVAMGSWGMAAGSDDWAVVGRDGNAPGEGGAVAVEDDQPLSDTRSAA